MAHMKPVQSIPKVPRSIVSCFQHSFHGPSALYHQCSRNRVARVSLFNCGSFSQLPNIFSPSSTHSQQSERPRSSILASLSHLLRKPRTMDLTVRTIHAFSIRCAAVEHGLRHQCTNGQSLLPVAIDHWSICTSNCEEALVVEDMVRQLHQWPCSNPCCYIYSSANDGADSGYIQAPLCDVMRELSRAHT
ncbi:hypothetical protein BDV18DRAFT_36630 [Aspergillus unguis]